MKWGSSTFFTQFTHMRRRMRVARGSNFFKTPNDNIGTLDTIHFEFTNVKFQFLPNLRVRSSQWTRNNHWGYGWNLYTQIANLSILQKSKRRSWMNKWPTPYKQQRTDYCCNSRWPCFGVEKFNVRATWHVV